MQVDECQVLGMCKGWGKARLWEEWGGVAAQPVEEAVGMDAA